MEAAKPTPDAAGDRRDVEGACALIVDDEKRVRSMLVDLLSREGFRCIEAADGEEAMRLLERHEPLLGVLDLALPGVSGAELAWRIREMRPDLKLVAVSGHLDSWDPDDLADIGFARVFPKPMDCEEFIRVCRQIADNRDIQDRQDRSCS